jgi:hypothetical protein
LTSVSCREFRASAMIPKILRKRGRGIPHFILSKAQPGRRNAEASTKTMRCTGMQSEIRAAAQIKGAVEYGKQSAKFVGEHFAERHVIFAIEIRKGLGFAEARGPAGGPQVTAHQPKSVTLHEIRSAAPERRQLDIVPSRGKRRDSVEGSKRRPRNYRQSPWTHSQLRRRSLPTIAAFFFALQRVPPGCRRRGYLASRGSGLSRSHPG